MINSNCINGSNFSPKKASPAAEKGVSEVGKNKKCLQEPRAQKYSWRVQYPGIVFDRKKKEIPTITHIIETFTFN